MAAQEKEIWIPDCIKISSIEMLGGASDGKKAVEFSFSHPHKRDEMLNVAMTPAVAVKVAEEMLRAYGETQR